MLQPHCQPLPPLAFNASLREKKNVEKLELEGLASQLTNSHNIIYHYNNIIPLFMK